MPRTRNWAKEVRDILISVGQVEVWQTESIYVPYEQFIYFVKRTLEDLYLQEWYTAIHQQDKMCTYTLIKTNLCTELYLNSQLPKYRMALSRLRLSSHS